MSEASWYSTGDPVQDRLLRRKLTELNIPTVPEAAAKDEITQEADPRSRRLAIEDKVLAKDPRQRRTTVLDFVRRGRLLRGTEIMPEIIQAMPALLDSSLIDFVKSDYDESTTISEILDCCKKVRLYVIQEDEAIRSALAGHGAMVDSRQYLNQSWYTTLVGQLSRYKKTIDQPNPSHPAIIAGRLDKYRRDVTDRFVKQLKNAGIHPTEQLVRDFTQDGATLTVDFPPIESLGPVEQFIVEKCTNNFFYYPTQAEYTGEVIQGPPNFEQVKVKPGIRVIARDTLPAEPGGVIFDGNFGYDERGKLVQPADKIIIDHHDSLNTKQYDTATVMAARFWQERLGRKFNLSSWKEELGKMREAGVIDDEGKKLITMVNDPDVDAMISVWVFRNPQKAKQYEELLNNISFCGDFLTGSRIMEFGANARDYNYIIMNYLKECREKIRQERSIAVELRKADVASQRDDLQDQLDELHAQREAVKANDPTIASLATALEVHKRKDVLPNERKAWLEQMRQMAVQLEEAIDTAIGEEGVAKKSTVTFKIKELGDSLAAIDRELKAQKNAALTAEDNAKIVSHFLNSMEDIIRQPFKYQKFLRQGREQEELGLAQVEEWYRNGDIEITTSERDSDILMLSSLKSKGMQRPESIDGMYFFLRRRIDFNRKIVVSLDGASFMVAINTQDRGELKHYDFNELVPSMRVREEILLNEQRTATRAEIASAGPSKRAVLEKDLARIDDLLKRNREGRLWRNRNQMAFVFRSVIPQGEYLERVHRWKQLEDQKLTIDALSTDAIDEQIQGYSTKVTDNVDRVMQLGDWSTTGEFEEDHKRAVEALVDRLPLERKGTFAGFDAGVACALDLIPRDKQRLAVELHARYSPEAVARIVADTKDILQLDPDSEVCWWLAACSICKEGDIDQPAFLKQLVEFEQLRTNPQARREAAIVEYRKMIALFKMETFKDSETGAETTAPYGEEDGCIQGAYIKGHRFGVSHLVRDNGSEWYELGSYEKSLGLADFPWTGTYRRNGRDYPNGPQYGAENFFRIGDKDQLARAISQVLKFQHHE